MDEEQRFENAQLKKFREEKKKLLDTSAEFDMSTILREQSLKLNYMRNG